MSTNRLMLIALLVAVVAGCASRVSQENYEKIRNDMSTEEVNRILGKPTEVASFGLGDLSASTSKWVGDTHTIVVAFANNKVKMKSYTRNENVQRSE